MLMVVGADPMEITLFAGTSTFVVVDHRQGENWCHRSTRVLGCKLIYGELVHVISKM